MMVEYLLIVTHDSDLSDNPCINIIVKANTIEDVIIHHFKVYGKQAIVNNITEAMFNNIIKNKESMSILLGQIEVWDLTKE